MSGWTHIREASASEVAEIIRHRRGMFYDMGFKETNALDMMERTSGQFIKEALADGRYHQWFAETLDSHVIGGAAVLTYPWVSSPLNHRPEKAYILNMYVYPEFRRKGVARQLLEQAIQWCRGEGFRSVDLHASEMGMPLYEKLGFRPTNEMRLEFS